MSSSQPAESSRRRQPRQDDRDDVQVAPYLTHVVAHHGQLTLIPPQNAGRIRKPTKKKKQAASRDRDRLLDDDEPRFTTAVPPSSSRKLHPAPAQVRTRKHALSNPTTPSPGSSSRRYDPIVDDHSIPDYPPPSFEDAIASPHVPPHLSSPAGSSRGAPEPPAQTQTEVQTQTQHPVTPFMPPVPVPSSAASTRTLYQSPAVSHVSLARSVDPHSIPPSPHLRSLHPAPSPLAFNSTSTLPSTAATESTAFLDTPLLRPPQPRSVPHSYPDPRERLPLALEQVAPQRREPSPIYDPPAPEPRDRSPAAAPYRLTSPSTTTLLSPAHAIRDVPAVSTLLPTSSPALSSAATSQVSIPRHTQPLPPLESSPPSSPYPQSRTSVATASDVFEEFTWTLASAGRPTDA
ncbi:hypothetical protein C8T65DRAFT_305077 [Cerioporus squamosus]|nr:hypothetical protein C8T65DRAFT_305077 [Cerioporus squamosus]